MRAHPSTSLTGLASLLVLVTGCSSGASENRLPTANAAGAGSSPGGSGSGSAAMSGESPIGAGQSGASLGGTASGGAPSGGGQAGTSGAGGAAARKGLRGVFFLVLNDHPPSYWASAVDEVAALGMDTIVVQTESFLTQTLTRNAVDRANLKAVLDEARLKKVQVHLGLALPEWGNGDPTQAANPTFVANLTAASKTSVDLLWTEYQGYKADGTWAGCYLAAETWTPGVSGQLGKLPDYVRDVSTYAKTKTGLLVSMSPFISALATDGGTATRTDYAAMFQVSQVDIVALQDGVGARSVPVASIPGQLPYYRAMKDACLGRCQLWANVESFASVSSSAPAPWSRLQAQMTSLAAEVPNQISYEYTNYWYAAGPSGSAGTDLRDAYAAWLATP